MTVRRELLWSSPLPPVRSGVADYATELVPELQRLRPIALVTPPDAGPAGAPLASLPRVPADEPPGERQELLHLGNNPYHLWIGRRLRRFGGTVVLHDTVLHHFLVEEAASDGAWRRLEDELASAHGPAGRAIAEGRRWGYSGQLDPFLFPARAALLRFARAVLVHNRNAAREVRAVVPASLPVRVVPLAVAAPAVVDRAVARKGLVADGEMLLVHLGFLTPAKGLDVVLRALVALAALKMPCRLLVVGEGSEQERIATLVAGAGLAERVDFTGYASREELERFLVAADLGLVPRYPTAGETSGAALRFLAAGTPAAVAGYAQFLDLPEAAAPRLLPGRAGSADLVRVVAGMASSAERRLEARAAARAAWEQGGHDPAAAAAAIDDVLRELV